MPFKKGDPKPPNSGRRKGLITQRIADAEDRWSELLRQFPQADEQEFLARVLACQVPCGTCHGSGRTKYVDRNNTERSRICQSCRGTRLEKICIPDRLKAAGLVVSRRWPERKAIDMKVEEVQDFGAKTPEQHAALQQLVKLAEDAGLL